MGSPHSVVLSLFLFIYSVMMALDFYLQIPQIVGGLDDSDEKMLRTMVTPIVFC